MLNAAAPKYGLCPSFQMLVNTLTSANVIDVAVTSREAPPTLAPAPISPTACLAIFTCPENDAAHILMACVPWLSPAELTSTEAISLVSTLRASKLALRLVLATHSAWLHPLLEAKAQVTADLKDKKEPQLCQ